VRKTVQVREPLLLNPIDTRSRLAQGAAYGLLGDIQMRLRNWHDAREAFQLAVAIYTPFHNDHKLDPHRENILEHTKEMLTECERRQAR